MEWVSPEVKQFYKILNKVYTTILINHHPYVKKAYIVPESFNDIFLGEESKFNDVDVIVCVDFLSKQYDEVRKTRSLGEDISSLMRELIKMVPNVEILQGRVIYAKVSINKKRYCEGLIPYTTDD